MITAIILAHNEEKNIQKVVKNTRFCNEVLVLNNASTDDTGKLARRAGARVITLHEQICDFSILRNKALTEAKNDWVLYIDSDEVVSPHLRDEIMNTIPTAEYDSYFIKREDIFFGRPLRFGETLKARNKGIIRLMKRGSGMWQGKVHEEFMSNKSSGTLQHRLIHHPHESIAHFLKKINYYSTLRADELFTAHAKVNILHIIFYPCGKFIFTYFILLGFIDGAPGFIYSFMMSFHSFLTRTKLYLQYKKM